MKMFIPASRAAALSAVAALALSAVGCGESLYDEPQDAPYVAPPAAGDMKPASKKKLKPQFGVPLGSLPAGSPSGAGAGASPA